jgi:hypothetical protein
MKTQILLSIVCSVSLLGSLSLPAKSQEVLTPPPTVSQEITIPQDTAIIISFPAPVTVHVGQKRLSSHSSFI